MSDARIELLLEGHIARLTIRRAEKLNAIDAGMADALLDACRKIERSDAGVAILTGEGQKSFCAGGDIDAWSQLDADNFSRRWLRDGHDVFDALARLSVPVIAVLNGHALGGGLELAACADMRIAEAHVKIGLPETGLGVIPGWSGTQRVSRRFGPGLVRRMALFGEVFSADEARSLGLVDQVVATGNGLMAAEAFASRLLQRSPRATELVKMLINVAEGEESERIVEALAGAVAVASDDLEEGLAAYRQKRRASFKKFLR
ncbi:enoyl-CoA hydratase/isomerase family protein [Brucella pseudogrignonensis]|uniref:enoyl-CoA hydratase/isomerase family protein n=1 Tax=Brucella/Ochrobactrum group TaxID=2826938 RepID=UPI000DE4259F|nr:enoyl-CoA hydratase/isomerase family protein [Brucella pseudogrignonensis]KAB2689090.1 enoyl-CoA hydratase/isomerase family protein [Brucella pseudogrignonensis]MBA8841432.1 enoyl-CoA hydratase/carnithine racemase [Ochrobactrum sp. RH2CCR150]